ncbi:hypothetical protein IAR55_005787 [Kwoniella newhampshirensis]|uniref:Uncharacterized protein n=1 Tax=Kwoniella newhampshirensis TaxID=1651941 RepID=A0AAW0YUS1_9TREE
MIRPTLTTQEIAIDLFTFLQEAPHTSSVYSPPIDTPSEPPQRPSPTRQWSGDTFAWWLEVDAVPDLILPNFDFELERESDGSTTCSPISNLSVLLAEEDGAPGETQSISLKAFLKEEADEDEDGAEGHHGPVAGFRDFVWGCGDIYGQSDHRQMCISPISSCRDLYSDHNTHSATMPYISTDRRISTSGTTPEKQEKMQRGEEGVILTFEAFLAEFPGSLSPRRTRSLGGAWKRAREVMKRVKV